MAKNKNRNRRDILIKPPIARRSLPYTITIIPRPRTSLLDDNRRFHPAKTRRTLNDLLGMRVKLRPRINRNLDVSFHAPRRAIICARRAIRREVMFATNKSGRGGQRKPRRNSRSYIKCRR